MNSKPAKFSIVGVILAVLAAVFMPRDDAANKEGQTESLPSIEAPAQSTPTPKAPSDTAPAAKQTDRTADPTTSRDATPSPSKQGSSQPGSSRSGTPTDKPAEQKPAANSPPPSTSRVGFTSRASWQSHFEKHGAEFGKITADEYLERAKALRDAPLSKDVLELVRDDGVITRFDKRSGDFVAFHEDKTIRTLFRPNDGEAYFRRQAKR